MDKPADIADGEIVRRCLAGERDAFAELVQRHQRVVYGVAVRMLGKRDQAEDAAQEAFVRAYSRLSTFRGDCAVRVWLIRIVTRLCLDLLRARRRRPEVFLDDHGGDPTDSGWESGVAERHAIARAIAELPPHYRAAIILRHLQHMPYSDMARALGIPLATAKTHLRRARQILQARLRPETADTGEEASQ
ncbi:MAG: sigma-70 family RNA polymerase sigma factor [Armatimonadota bacterium]|nr:MAG: sigma-70 family RNA polymerase sigma factor [Armatimonadota bacterium]